MSIPDKTALIPLVSGAEEMEVSIIVDVLRRGGVKVTLAGVSGSGAVTCSRGLRIVPDVALGDVAGSFDAVVLPGYVDARKVCSIGIRVRRGCSYHGIAFNVDMDLSPFHRINPCGYAGLEMTQVSALGGPGSVRQVAEDLTPALLRHLRYNGAPVAALAGA